MVFNGSHLTEQLVEYRADFHVFVRATSSGELRNIRHLRDDVTVHRGDLRHEHSVEQAMSALSEYSETIVFHLAAQAHVGESRERPYETIDTNVVGTLNLLQTVVDLDLDIEKFDTAGASEEYGDIDAGVEDLHEYENDGRVLLNERSPVNPKSVYATRKLAANYLTMNYHDAYGILSATNRVYNNYGPRQNPRYTTGTIMTQHLKRDIIEIG